jgi:hypothetical protein
MVRRICCFGGTAYCLGAWELWLWMLANDPLSFLDSPSPVAAFLIAVAFTVMPPLVAWVILCSIEGNLKALAALYVAASTFGYGAITIIALSMGVVRWADPSIVPGLCFATLSASSLMLWHYFKSRTTNVVHRAA